MHVKAPNGGSDGRRVFWNGAIHWMSHANVHNRPISHANVHNRFDVDAENLTSMPMFLGKDEIWYFGECGGSLLLIQTVYASMGFRVLEMKKDCCHWIVKHQFSVRPIRYVHPKGYCAAYSLFERLYYTSEQLVPSLCPISLVLCFRSTC
ncbi:hypothetical protein RHSIM_Rhsim03G0249200 [Rhododendron simsii]|uniref:Uncharacterized protein n=1 Tax=Rhododendron simsii TaxID=118357 RepID=A0A834H7U7_RHOSS|nr:hypothetical protein RHSIM_Rhsim03G0249200 [Rhododendron simsii]